MLHYTVTNTQLYNVEGKRNFPTVLNQKMQTFHAETLVSRAVDNRVNQERAQRPAENSWENVAAQNLPPLAGKASQLALLNPEPKILSRRLEKSKQDRNAYFKTVGSSFELNMNRNQNATDIDQNPPPPAPSKSKILDTIETMSHDVLSVGLPNIAHAAVALHQRLQLGLCFL